MLHLYNLCKICGGNAPSVGSVDMIKNCERLPWPDTGIDVYYMRCEKCGFLFTDFCDDWTMADFEHCIYNDAYAEVDPDFMGKRAEANAAVVATVFSAGRGAISVLDWGSGKGDLGRHLLSYGFNEVVSYDPIFERAEPEGKFNLITAFEVLEHVVEPKETVRLMAKHLAPGGLILFTTLLQHGGCGLDWWYVAPRNGHISIHTQESLRKLWDDAGFWLTSHNENLHHAQPK